MKGLNSQQQAMVLGALDHAKTTHDKWYEFVDAMIQALGGVGLDDELARLRLEKEEARRKAGKPFISISLEAMRQQEISWMWNEEVARQTKGKTMLDTSKKYKVGSVVYRWDSYDYYWKTDSGEVIYPAAMQQLYDDGLAIGVKEPFEKTITVKFNRSGCNPELGSDFVRIVVGGHVMDFKTVAGRTFDVTIKERL